MKVKNEERREKVECAQQAVRATEAVIGCITKARDEAKELIESAENTREDELFEAKIDEAIEKMFGALRKVAMVNTLAMALTAISTQGIDIGDLIDIEAFR